MLHVLSVASIAVLLSISSGLRAQTDTLQNPEQYLFPKFSGGTVAMKLGRDNKLIMNYNIVTEKMVFIQKGQIYNMLNQESVDTIYLYNRKFIPVGRVFYEVALEAPLPLFIQHKAKIESLSKPAPYGVASEASSSKNINYKYVKNDYSLKYDPNLIIKPYPVYWVRINYSLLSFQTEKQFLNILPDFRNEIKQYTRQYKPKFANPNDIIKLMVYCNSLIK